MTGEFQIDWARAERTGFPEAVLCSGKSPGQIDAIVEAAMGRSAPLLLTRLSAETFALLKPEVSARLVRTELSQTATFAMPETAALEPGVGILTAGTSDLGIAHEAASTLRFMGYEAPIIADVGVAGLWRLLSRIEEVRRFRVIIAVAGMEGALFSVVAGLVSAPVIAVPASIGYGVAAGGQAALTAALASCSPGIVTVNVGNGFGAAVAAVKMMRLTKVT